MTSDTQRGPRDSKAVAAGGGDEAVLSSETLVAAEGDNALAGPTEAASKTSSPYPIEPRTRPFRILVAEDDAEMRRLVVDALRDDGYEVVEVVDGGRLLVDIAARHSAKTENTTVDLIVSDIRMPVCSGLEILDVLRQARWRTPVILMTAFGDEATRTRAKSLMAVLFDKPFDLDDLRTAVVNLLRR